MTMTILRLVELGVVLLLVGAVASLVLARRRRLAGWISTLFVAAFAVTAWLVLLRLVGQGPEAEARLMALPSIGASMAVSVDVLSALFLIIAATVAVLATLYSIEYMTHYERDGVGKYYPVLLVFFASIVGVLVAADFLFFLVAWELMTLSSFFLVVYEREDPAAQRAGLKYFVITHAATLCMVAAGLILWRRSGSFSFAAMADALGALLAEQPFVGHLVILLLVLGFATKAGILPMGDWLPDAHPAAPSGMSAALSGVLVKLGVYGLVRVFLTFVPVAPALSGWGVAVALAGTASLFVGTLTALQQTDTKRLMAFHTIGQIGYVFLGLGVGIGFLPHHPTLAALGMMAGLFHAANHACFKACLFLGAGSVLLRTGQRDMDRLGGLAPEMPVTATSSTIAALAIAGLPPLNGFASKWLIVGACFLAGLESPLYLVLAVVAVFVSLATLASFLKVLAAVFFGAPRTAGKVREVPLSMTLPQGVLAFACVVLGLFPRLALDLIHDAVAALARVPIPAADELLGTGWGVALAVDGRALAGWSPLVMGAAWAVLALIVFAIQRAGAAGVREVPVWNCGEVHPPEEVRYPATSFYLPFKRAFHGIYPRLALRAPSFPAFLKRLCNLDGWFYMPIADSVLRGAQAVSRTHSGIPQIYLVWIVVGAIAVVGALLALLS